ncbi:MAG: class I SAM-dependent methyltransferase [Bacteroidia bacterium]|nr:class I SAM-dependent methyltransferase [Bacteroidia bacterium]
MDAEFWNNRYQEQVFAYGEEPNEFLADELRKLKPGKILFAAEGEGRNAVFAAELGWEVWAFDQSKEGQKKAIELANKRGVKINYLVGDASEINWDFSSFDAIALIYSHLPPSIRTTFHLRSIDLLKNEGHIIMEGFSLNNLEYVAKNPAIGGPKNPDFLFSIAMVEQDFHTLQTLVLEEVEIELHEGVYHNGTGCVIRYIGKK